MTYPKRHTKIVATIGPASSSEEKIQKLLREGVNVFRLNFSHGVYSTHAAVVGHIRAAEKMYGTPVAILADLQGPKLRVGKFLNEAVHLKRGQLFELDLLEDLGTMKRVQFPHANLYGFIHPGDKLLLDDGKIKLMVVESTATKIVTKVEISGKISNHKGVNIPDSHLKISALTKKDLKDLDFIKTLDVDYIALSFVQSASDVLELRKLIQADMKIIAKIEKPQALEDIEAILEASDGVMVARGDLGVEMDLERVPIVQKELIRQARKKALPVIVATQMLESMITAPAPTRAEVSDVANAVLDGADAVMLSAESAAGSYPIEAVQMMKKIILATELGAPSQAIAVVSADQNSACDAVASTASHMAQCLRAAAVVCSTVTGSTARRVAQSRGVTPIIALTPEKRIARQLCLVWSVRAFVSQTEMTFENMTREILQLFHDHHLGNEGDKIVVTGSNPVGQEGKTNMFQVIEMK